MSVLRAGRAKEGVHPGSVGCEAIGGPTEMERLAQAENWVRRELKAQDVMLRR
jgi:hypothetical protein